METCCLIVVVAVIGLIIYSISSSASEKNAEKERKIKNYKNALANGKSNVNSQVQYAKNSALNFFDENTVKYDTEQQLNSYTKSCISSMQNCIQSANQSIAELKRVNGELVKLNSQADQSQEIRKLEKQAVSEIKNMINSFEKFQNKVRRIPYCKMIEENNYGMVNNGYWDMISSMERSKAKNYILNSERTLNNRDFNEIMKLDVEELIKCIWRLAVDSNFLASDFQKGEKAFRRIYRLNHPDVVLAGFYAKQKVGGDAVLRDPIRDFLKEEEDSKKLALVASGLMWMKAYQSETTVLQSMLTNGKDMTTKMQQRLHSLTNGGGKAPGGFSAKSANDLIYFDVSALAWRDDEYNGLFENLAFEGKTLTYSLAVRDENKEILLPLGLNVPGVGAVLNKFQSAFAKEYGSGVRAKAVKCVAMSGSGEEKMRGILAVSDQCRQMSILMHIAKIGKKVNIKFYTLFMPESQNLGEQKQQSLSMYKKLSPTVAMWESSLKDTMLRAVEQLINAGAMAGAAAVHSSGMTGSGAAKSGSRTAGGGAGTVRSGAGAVQNGTRTVRNGTGAAQSSPGTAKGKAGTVSGNTGASRGSAGQNGTGSSSNSKPPIF